MGSTEPSLDGSTGSKSRGPLTCASGTVISLALAFFAFKRCSSSEIDTGEAAPRAGAAASLDQDDIGSDGLLPERSEILSPATGAQQADSTAKSAPLTVFLEPQPDIYQCFDSLVRIADGYSKDDESWRWFSDLRVCDLYWGLDHLERIDLALAETKLGNFISGKDKFEPFSRCYYRDLIEQANSVSSGYTEKALFDLLVNSYETHRDNPRMELYLSRLIMFHVAQSSLDQREMESLCSLRMRIINSEGEGAIGRLIPMIAIAEKRIQGSCGWINGSDQSIPSSNVPVSRPLYMVLDNWINSNDPDLSNYVSEQLDQMLLGYSETAQNFLTSEQEALIGLIASAANSGVFDREKCQELVAKIPVGLLNSAILRELSVPGSEERQITALNGDNVHLLLAPLFIAYGTDEQRAEIKARSEVVDSNKPRFTKGVVSLLVDRGSFASAANFELVSFNQESTSLDIVTLLRGASSGWVSIDTLLSKVSDAELELGDRLEILNYLLCAGGAVLSDQNLERLFLRFIDQHDDELLVYSLLFVERRLPSIITTKLSALIVEQDSSQHIEARVLQSWVRSFIDLRLSFDSPNRSNYLDTKINPNKFSSASVGYLSSLNGRIITQRTLVRIERAIEEFRKHALN